MRKRLKPAADASRKLIGGSPHIKVPCCECGGLIWTAESHMLQDGSFVEQCSDCNPYIDRSHRNSELTDVAAGVDFRYHGSWQ